MIEKVRTELPDGWDFLCKMGEAFGSLAYAEVESIKTGEKFRLK